MSKEFIIEDDEKLFTTKIIMGNNMVLIQDKDNKTKDVKQMLFHLSDWDKINKIINDNR